MLRQAGQPRAEASHHHGAKSPANNTSLPDTAPISKALSRPCSAPAPAAITLPWHAPGVSAAPVQMCGWPKQSFPMQQAVDSSSPAPFILVQTPAQTAAPQVHYVPGKLTSSPSPPVSPVLIPARDRRADSSPLRVKLDRRADSSPLRATQSPVEPLARDHTSINVGRETTTDSLSREITAPSISAGGQRRISPVPPMVRSNSQASLPPKVGSPVPRLAERTLSRTQPGGLKQQSSAPQLSAACRVGSPPPSMLIGTPKCVVRVPSPGRPVSLSTSAQPGPLDPNLVQALQSVQLRSSNRASLPTKLRRFSQPSPVAARVPEVHHAQHDQQPQGQQQGYVQWPMAPVQLMLHSELTREVTHESGCEEEVHTGSSILGEPLQSQVMFATGPARGAVTRELSPVWHEADVCTGAALPCRRSRGLGMRRIEVPRLSLPVDEAGRADSSDSEDTTEHNQLVTELSAARDAADRASREAESLRIALASAKRNASRADQEAEDLRTELAALKEETTTVAAARINSRKAPQFSVTHAPGATSSPLRASQGKALEGVILAEMAATREASCKAQSDVQALRAELAMLTAQFRSAGSHLH